MRVCKCILDYSSSLEFKQSLLYDYEYDTNSNIFKVYKMGFLPNYPKDLSQLKEYMTTQIFQMHFIDLYSLRELNFNELGI